MTRLRSLITFICYNESMVERRKLPIGIQTFEKIRAGDYVYVDKTDNIMKVAVNYSSKEEQLTEWIIE